MGKREIAEDNMSIYQKRGTQSEKEKWSEMDRQGKWAYFNEYYRNKLIIGLIGVIAVIGLLYSMFRPKVEQVVYAAVVNDRWNDTAEAMLQDDLEEYLEVDPKWEEVKFDDGFFFEDDTSAETYDYVQKLATYVASGDVDLIIADEEKFKGYATQDYFSPLDEVLPEDLYTLLEEHLVTYTSEFDGQEYVVGIRMDASSVHQSLSNSQKEVLLGIMANSEFQENAVEVIRYFFTLDADYRDVKPVEE